MAISYPQKRKIFRLRDHTLRRTYLTSYYDFNKFIIGSTAALDKLLGNIVRNEVIRIYN